MGRNVSVQVKSIVPSYLVVFSLYCRPIVDLIKGRNVSVQVKAASALEALAEDNPASQKVFLDLDAPKALIKLLKVT